MQQSDSVGLCGELLFHPYMEQIFEKNFVHVDPHSGNLFVKPAGNESSARLFQVVFIDFGMMSVIPNRLRRGERRRR